MKYLQSIAFTLFFVFLYLCALTDSQVTHAGGQNIPTNSQNYRLDDNPGTPDPEMVEVEPDEPNGDLESITVNNDVGVVWVIPYHVLVSEGVVGEGSIRASFPTKLLPHQSKTFTEYWGRMGLYKPKGVVVLYDAESQFGVASGVVSWETE